MTVSLAAVFMLVGQATATHPASESIASFVAQSGDGFDDDYSDYDILLTAVSAADLVGPLADPSASLTLFAPNDLAFIRLAQDVGYEGHDEAEAFGFIVTALTELGGGDPIPLLTQILLYHVIPAEVDLFDVFIASGQHLPTLLDGATITPWYFTLIDANADFTNPHLVAPANVFTGNGIVHSINRVLIPLSH